MKNLSNKLSHLIIEYSYGVVFVHGLAMMGTLLPPSFGYLVVNALGGFVFGAVFFLRFAFMPTEGQVSHLLFKIFFLLLSAALIVGYGLSLLQLSHQ